MSLGRGLFREIPGKKESPVRPSTFHETVSERTEEPQAEYAATPDDAALDKPEDYGFTEFPDRPVGVYLTAPIPSDRPLRDWSGATVTVGTVPSNIGAGDRARSRMIVRNLSAADRVYLLRYQNDNPMLGIALPPGQDVELQHTSPVWAVAATNPVEISYHVEFTVDEIDD